LGGMIFFGSGVRNNAAASRPRLGVLAAAFIAGVSLAPYATVAQGKKHDESVDVAHSFKDYKGTVRKGDILARTDFAAGKEGFYGLAVSGLDDRGLELSFLRQDGAGKSPAVEHGPWTVKYGEKQRLGDLNLWFRVSAKKGSEAGTADIELRYMTETKEKRVVKTGDPVTERASFSDLKVSKLDGRGIEVSMQGADGAKPCRIPYGGARITGDYEFPFKVEASKARGKTAGIAVTYPAVGFPKAGHKGICEKK
jgi:hypothetical protein